MLGQVNDDRIFIVAQTIPLTWLHSHTFQLFTKVTTVFYNPAHTRKFLGRIFGRLCERNHTGQLVIFHILYSRENNSAPQNRPLTYFEFSFIKRIVPA